MLLFYFLQTYKILERKVYIRHSFVPGFYLNIIKMLIEPNFEIENLLKLSIAAQHRC
jgi:hypothetical protein